MNLIGDIPMSTLSASEARAKLYRLIDDIAFSHEQVFITSKRANAVLVTEEDWTAIQETLYLLSIPGLRESLKKGFDTPLKKCTKEIKW